MKFRAMGKGMSRRWLRKTFKLDEIHFQSATWVAQLPIQQLKVEDDSKFSKYWSSCEPELFPGSRLVGVNGPHGAKINLFHSGKCVCLGKLFHKRHDVHNILSTVLDNIQL